MATPPATDNLAFDEEWYLGHYPQIAIQVERGGFSSGYDHFVKHGREEGRLPVPPTEALAESARKYRADLKVAAAFGNQYFNEAWYLHRYPAVAKAVMEGGFSSGLEHYLRHGKAEGRHPLPTYTTEQTTLLKQFCSLGEDCEFGLVQQYYGCHPIDIFRWAKTPMTIMLRLLESRLQDIGSKKYLRIELDGTGKEWAVVNTKYQFLWHSWTTPEQMSGEAILNRETKRIPRLADKLCEELDSGERIFVRWNGRNENVDAEAESIFAAIQTYNDKNSLLAVRLADDTHLAGTVELRRDRLFIGYIRAFSVDYDRPATTDVAAWLELCQQTAILVTRSWCAAGEAARPGPLAAALASDRAVSSETAEPTRMMVDSSLTRLAPRHHKAAYLNPTDLCVTQTPFQRVALVGSCFLQKWNFHRSNPTGCQVDLIVVGDAGQLPTLDTQYDFLVVQIALRSILPDATQWHLPYNAVEAYEKAFTASCEKLKFHLACRMAWNEACGLLTFVANFLVPQRNPHGSLYAKYDLRNPEYFIDRLNETLEQLVLRYKNAYILDTDRIAASIGRRYVQDDSTDIFSHNSLIGATAIGVTSTRIEPLAPMANYYDLTNLPMFCDAMWAEIVAMYRIVYQMDAVKLVVVDLDDTLWNGVSGDMTSVGPDMLEGWPLGVIEALMYLKLRGVLLAVVSKNEESRVRQIWDEIFLQRLGLTDFAAVRISWRPKVENMQEILRLINVLPRNVVFIDDNPAEREAMQQAFPEMRILGRHPFYLRRILLWSAETQTAVLTEESIHRTTMVQQQLEREADREVLSREAFLTEAAPIVTVSEIFHEHPRFTRAFELLNKTNQYNTTGRRWRSEELSSLLAVDWRMFAFDVKDRYTSYGLVGVILTSNETIEQWVMSCRVLGYQIENAVMAVIIEHLRGIGTIKGRLCHTDVNFPCRELFAACGFTAEDEELWSLPASATVASPSHITIEITA